MTEPDGPWEAQHHAGLWTIRQVPGDHTLRPTSPGQPLEQRPAIICRFPGNAQGPDADTARMLAAAWDMRLALLHIATSKDAGYMRSVATTALAIVEGRIK